MAAQAEAIALAKRAAAAASDKFAKDIVIIDVSEELNITDCFVIVSASNDRQVGAIVDEVEEQLRAEGSKPVRREGGREGRWVLLDYVDVVVHVQHEEQRAFYSLDRLWHDCPRIEFVENTPAALIADDPLADDPEGKDHRSEDSAQ